MSVMLKHNERYDFNEYDEVMRLISKLRKAGYQFHKIVTYL
jgi:hypothetical protein